MQSKPFAILHLPDTLAHWPWPRAINPYYEEVKAASNAWFESFKAFTPESQLAFDKCDFARLASLAYPRASKEHLRTGCDLMNLFFLFDEYTDVEPTHVVSEMADIVMDSLKNPHKPRPRGEIVLGEVARQFWQRAIKSATSTSQRHMIESFTAYLESVVQQAYDRDTNVFLTVDSYFEKRRENVGVRSSYVPLELNLSLPDHVFYHPTIQELSYLIADLIILDNDIASYNKEQATGDDQYNILTIVMHQFDLDLHGAVEWAETYHAKVATKFLDGLKRIPSWVREIDQQVHEYVEGLANWPRSNVCWNFEGGRYFGSKGQELQRTREVVLLPKAVPVHNDPSLRKGNVVVPFVDKLSMQVVG